jgi:integrase
MRARRTQLKSATASGKARHIPLNSKTVAVLKQWEKQEPEGRLFKLECTAKAWGRLMAKAKLEDFRFHDLRHAFASKLAMAGIDLNAVRELLGHGDIKMTLRYAHLVRNIRRRRSRCWWESLNAGFRQFQCVPSSTTFWYYARP